MPVLISVPPETLKRMLEEHGCSLIDQDEYNWCLSGPDEGPPILVPKLGEIVAFQVRDNIIHRANIDANTYIELIKKVQPDILE